MLDELEHELERLRAYRADVEDPDAGTVADARLALMRMLADEQPQPTAARTPRERLRRLQRRRRFALAGGLATLGVGIAGALGFTTAATPITSLAAQLHQLARVADAQTPLAIPGPNQYLYTESESSYVDGTGGTSAGSGICWLRQTEDRQTWISVGSGSAIQQSLSDGQFTSAADKASCAAVGITNPAQQNSDWKQQFRADTTASLVFPTQDWSSLSTDPATLLQQIRKVELNGGVDTPKLLFADIGNMLRESDAPPAIRAALYTAAGLIPNVKLIGTVADPLGTSGVAIALYQDGKPVSELIFDPQTSELTAEETLGADGQPTDWSVYLKQSIVDALPDYPMDDDPADQGPPASAVSQTDTTQSTTATSSVQTTSGNSTPVGTTSTPGQATGTDTTDTTGTATTGSVASTTTGS